MKPALPVLLVLLATVPPAPARLDTNGNGMSDIWEQHFNSGELFGPAFLPIGDADADGQSNLMEATAGTDPLTFDTPDGHFALSVRHVAATWLEDPEEEEPVLLTPEAFEIEWFGVAGKQYTLLFSPDLAAESWIPVGDPVIGNDGPVTIGDLPEYEEGGLPEAIFWRVEVRDIDSDVDGLTDHEEHLLGSNPLLADTSGDGVPDFWLAAHGMAVADDHSASLFPGFTLTVPEAFRSGVQARPTATPDDLDGDGVLNLVDADPHDITVRWRRTCTPVWALRSTELSTEHQVLDLSPAGSMLFLSPSPTNQLELLRLPDLQIRNIPDAPPGDANGFFHHPLSGVLHGERVFGQRVLDSNNPPSTEWAYFDPVAATVTGAGVPQNNPPEAIWDAIGSHVSAVGGGFPALFGGHQGYFESDESAVALDHQNNMLRYWTFAAGTYDAGRAITGAGTSDFSGNRSSTLRQALSGQSEVVYHLVPTRKGLFAAEGGGAFSLTGVLDSSGLSYWKTWATKQGWMIDENRRLWSNGTWGDVEARLPRRAADGAQPEIQQIHKARDTGFVLATTRYPGGTWKHALLMPVQLQVHFPASGLTIPWEDYLPGYEGTVPKLCPAGRSAFEGSHVRTAQAVELVFSGPTVEQADSVQVTIEQVSSLAGWSGNDGDDGEADFSFAAGSDTTSASAAVQAGLAAVTIHCKDYAAWTALHVTLLKNNQPIHDQPLTVTLPLDSNGDRIADTWQREEVRSWNTQYRLDPDDPAWVNPNDSATWAAVFGTDGSEDAEPADSDGEAGTMPAMADDGDGLKAIEEYRGFFLDGGPGLTNPRHKRLSAARKDLLVECSEMAGIASTTLRLPPDANENFTDQGNDPNAFAQGYSLATTMGNISRFFSREGRPASGSPAYFPGASLDTWWVKDTLTDMGYVVYENGTMGSTHKYSGPYEDLQRPDDATRNRNGWLSIASDHNLAISDPEEFSILYGGNEEGTNGGQGVAVLGNYGNRNNECAHFIKLAVQGRKGFKSTNGNFYAMKEEAAREQDDRQERRETHQGAAIFVNSLSEESDLVNQAAFEGRLQWSIAHELAHLFIGGDDGHFDGSGIVLSKTTEVGLSKFVEDEIINIKLRQRASINRDAEGNQQP